MNFRFERLDLTFKKATVAVPFSPQLTFIHGQVGTGKSSIARLVDWCLGSKMSYTPALQDELVSAALTLTAGSNQVRIVRNREDSSHVRISWIERGAEPQNAVVPLTGSGSSADPTVPETLSDFLFVLAGTTPLRVPKSRRGEDSSLQRLSFRDFMAFCHLEQETLNSSLMRFGIPIQGRKSEDVMRAVLGLYSERQQRLQAQSDGLLRQSNDLEAEAKQVTAFLDRLGVDDQGQIDLDLRTAERQEAEAREQRRALEAAAQLPAAHPAEQLRARLRELDGELAERRAALEDLAVRANRDRKLRAELITAQLKLGRSAAAVEVLEGVAYTHCPQCGKPVLPTASEDECGLCHQTVETDSAVPAEAAEADLQARIDELGDALERQRQALIREERKLGEREALRRELDLDLVRELRVYESMRMAAARDIERRLATANGDAKRLRSAEKLRREVRRIREESGQLIGRRKPILEQLREENQRLAARETFRDEIAEAFREALLSVGMPDITPDDRVLISDKLIPVVEPASGTASYGFDNLGSSGMKTMFQCCYALALHRVAAEHDLLLPRFLIIDTPAQHVDEKVDSELFHGFFRYLYTLLEGPMRAVQVILIESEFEPPPTEINLVRRQLRRHDPAHPRLVPYYRSNTEPVSGADDA